MRVLVCGGRRNVDPIFIYRQLDRLHKKYLFDVVIEGDAPGTDRIAGYWARRKRIDNIKEPVTPAEYDSYGRGAPLKRNQRMLDKHKPQLVIAFPGGNGTADMIARAEQAGVEVVRVIVPAEKRQGPAPPGD